MKCLRTLAWVALPGLLLAAQSNEKPSPIRNHVRGPHSAEAYDPGPDAGIACYYVSKEALSAVHASIPVGSRVKVTNLRNQKTVTVTVTGHSALPGRLISVSRDAADQLGFVSAGTTDAKLEVLK